MPVMVGNEYHERVLTTSDNAGPVYPARSAIGCRPKCQLHGAEYRRINSDGDKLRLPIDLLDVSRKKGE